MKAENPLIDRILDRLQQVKRSGTGWSARCPAHEDHNPSLTIGEGEGGRVLLHCHGNCSVESIVAAVGLTVNDLFPEDAEPELELVASYDYVDADGSDVFQVLRFRDQFGRKTFRQRRKEYGSWVYNTTGLKKPIYRLPDVLNAVKFGRRIWIVEGEKDVHALESKGEVATCNPGGAGKWLSYHSESLVGAKEIIIIADHDRPGRSHATAVFNDLVAHGIARANIQVYQPPEGFKDAADMIEANASLDTLETFIMGDVQDDPFVEVLEKTQSLLNRKELTLEQKASRMRGVLDKLVEPKEAQPNKGRLVRWDTFLKEPTPEYDWVIPDLLERSERVMLVAPEGAGKTMLLRQIALMTAAGIHPFRLDRIPPQTTLTFDLENPERIIKRTSRKMMERIRWYSGITDVDAHLLLKPDGIDLLKPEGRNLVEEYVSTVEPDLVILGPMYKAYIAANDKSAEAAATEVAKFLDHIRSTYKCALWLEHHAPLGSAEYGRDLRPFGSSVWLRWSEFGIALYPDVAIPYEYDVKHFRGMRDERAWPRRLKRGEMWPFEVVTVPQIVHHDDHTQTT